MQLREDVNTGILALLTAFLFFGSATLLALVVMFNPINPSSVYTVIFFIVSGLVSGVIAATLVTSGELRILNRKGEFKTTALSIVYAGAVGLPVFLLVNFLFETLGSAYVFGEVFFLLAGLFTYSIVRLTLLVRWEIRNKRVLMIQYGFLSSSARLHASLGRSHDHA